MIAKQKGLDSFYKFIAEMFIVDVDNQLTLEEHAFIPKRVCITHRETKRAISVTPEEYVCTIDYINGHGKVADMQAYDVKRVAERTMLFLDADCEEI